MTEHFFPMPLDGFYDRPMWDSIRAKSMRLQRCQSCGAFQYPPAPACVECLSEDLAWTEISGEGVILSWVVYHRQYLPTYPAPYNVISVRLREGPILTSNLEGQSPEGSWIGAPVKLFYRTFPDGSVLPRFTLASTKQQA